MKTLMVFFCSVLSFSFAAAAVGEEGKEIRRRAQNRLYPGGKDEEPLRVLSALPSSVRKKASQVDFEAEEPTEQNTSDTPNDNEGEGQ